MESTLADTYRDVIGSLGFEAGWGRGPDNGDPEWDSDQFTTLKLIMKSGLRQFYKPPPDQAGVSHQWSFLSPFVRLALASGQRELRMPRDFGGVEGNVYVASANAGGTPGICQVGGGVRALYAVYPNSTGRPAVADIEALRTSGADGQKWQMVFYPEPNADYTIEFYYSILGEMLTGDLPFAYGGPDHSETILASCLAVWENRIDDIPNGPRYQHWRERLAASISIDRAKRPQTLGYNADNSDDRYERRSGRYSARYGYPRLRLNGVLFD